MSKPSTIPLDTCEEAGILPDNDRETGGRRPVRLSRAGQATRFRITVSRQWSGIVRQRIPRVFAKLLYGSKFHRMRMSRRQRASGFPPPACTGNDDRNRSKVISTTVRGQRPSSEVQIDTKKNEPLVHDNKQIRMASATKGTEVTLELRAVSKGGRRSTNGRSRRQLPIRMPLVYHP